MYNKYERKVPISRSNYIGRLKEYNTLILNRGNNDDNSPLKILLRYCQYDKHLKNKLEL